MSNGEDTYEGRLPALICGLAATGTGLVVLALWPYSVSPATDAKYFLIGLMPLVLALPWAIHVVRNRKGRFTWRWPLSFLAALLALNLMAALHSAERGSSLAEWRRYVALGLVCFIVAQSCHGADRAWKVLKVICGAVGLASLYGLAQKAGWDPFPWAARNIDEYLGLPSTFGNPNVATHALNLAFICACGLALRRETRWWALAAAIIGIHIYLTQVRAARLALSAGFLFAAIAWLVQRRWGASRRSVGITLTAFAFMAGAGAAGTMAAYQVAKGAPLPVSHPFLLRYNSFYGASRMILDRPWLGFGPGTYWMENPPYWTPYEQSFFATDARFNRNVHNALLEWGVESGFGGAFLYIGFLAALVVQCLGTAYWGRNADTRKLGYVLGACFVAFGVDGQFGFNFRSPASALMLMVLAGVAAGVFPSAEARRPTGPRVLRVAVSVMLVVAGAGLAMQAGAVFAAQELRQKARGANAWGNPEQALACLRQAQRLAPWHSAIPAAIGDVEGQLDHPRAAIAAYQLALRLDSNRPMRHVALARQYFKLAEAGDKEARALAREAAGRALALCPVLPEAHEQLGRIQIIEALDPAGPRTASEEARRQELLEGIRHLDDALKMGAADRGQVHRMMAQAYSALGTKDLAQRSFLQAAESAPFDDATWVFFEQFAAATGQWDRYIDALINAVNRAEDLQPPDGFAVSRTAWWLARAYRDGLKDPVLTRQTLLRGLRACPEDLALWGAWVTMANGLDDPERLAAALAELTGAQGGSIAAPQPVRDLQSCLPHSEADAVTQAETFLGKLPKPGKDLPAPEVGRRYAWLFDVYGNFLKRSVESGALRAQALWKLARAAAEISAWAQVDSLMAAATPLVTDDRRIDFLLERARALGHLNRNEEALALCREAAQAAPGDFRAQHALARQLAANGKTAEARLLYRVILTQFALDGNERYALETEMAALEPDSGP